MITFFGERYLIESYEFQFHSYQSLAAGACAGTAEARLKYFRVGSTKTSVFSTASAASALG
ncbi:hypothetical protein MSG37_01540 [Shewanella sp. 1CM18E]|uniref:hypothetical protein n=1 Tax=Shewanella sp. 1CM18E TaxID=2929169 RepID=UPI0020C0D603|nr:hypothetical protein [Shewanella sp. 1CM18E]MCK8043558.1 hypothetical protein [Shewanella sp. 1CM18E]